MPEHCENCGNAGEPYTYRGKLFSGLHANRGRKLCPACCEADITVQGINILVVDDRASVGSFVYNTVRDADKMIIWIPPELRGIDGRDKIRTKRKRRAKRNVLPSNSQKG